MNNQEMQSESGLCCHGTPVQADEGRTAAICTNNRGDTRLVIAARGYAVIVDPQEGTSKQVHFPANNKDYPYASLSSRSGMFYVGAGNLLMALDPFAGRFVDCCEAGHSGEAVGFSLAEDSGGTIYAASYPTCRLHEYVPSSRTLTELGRLDVQEDYPFHLAVDRDGWVYAGIGTERCVISARDPENGEVRLLVVGEDRVSGKGIVRLGSDGEVYGRLAPSSISEPQPWFRLKRGAAIPISDREVADSDYTGTGFQTVHRRFPAPWRLLRYSLPDKEAVVMNETCGRELLLPLSYESEGADLSPLAAGPDGNLYGTSNHPLHLYRYDPQADVLQDLGGRWTEKNGNICAYAIQGNWIAGAAYAGGHVFIIDTSRPFHQEPGEAENPRLVASVPEIYRPRCALAHPDGEHVIFGGYGNYGVVGGGLYIRNLADRTEQVLTPDRLIRHHSTMCIVPLPGGDLLCGTSVEAPGGGKPKDTEGRLYRLDWRTKEVVYSEAPIPGAREIALMEIDSAGLVHAFTDKLYFVYDPQARRVLRQEEIAALGGLVRQGLVKSEAGRIYGLRGQAIFTIDTDTCRLVCLLKPPHKITSGLALLNDRLYYASGKQLWSMRLGASEHT
ncbi:hypothetical protein FE783_30850 [Paenibacillus mesophilus]|uniref:hypothetical protein n=1 Tax=Paenibacillus mesophilus TaxID=2582849 RepID=UPI00110D721E|nr:hypothetical protein [Paenibacillus mesophilus]TMV44924.1 hypothetical protein FE783_30850 [Paenibacillus mesophilus]